MRKQQERKAGSALLDRAEDTRPTKQFDDIRRPLSEPLRPRREYPGASANDGFSDEEASARLRARGRRVRRGLIPQSRAGRIAAGVGMLLFLGAVGAGSFYGMRFLHRDPHFVIASSSSIELRGNEHLSRSQLLSVFGEDIDGNVFDVPMSTRREQLEQIPWVEHATLMRLLPNRMRVEVKERTPVAFVRQGGTIGMADANGVLLDIPPDAPGNPNYSFPVVTGLKATDSPESREQRMHLYTAFLRDLDSDGKKVSGDLSEIDLSDPEDVKALLPYANGETLVHFGTSGFLSRYKRFQENIAEWRTQYPRLSSVDMRYERQVVLQMPPKDSTVTPSAVADAAGEKATSPAKTDTASQHVAHASPPKGVANELVATIPPAHHAEATAVKRPKPTVSAKKADMAKRVEAIKAWMAKRQQGRDTSRTQSATP